MGVIAFLHPGRSAAVPTAAKSPVARSRVEEAIPGGFPFRGLVIACLLAAAFWTALALLLC
jgi:hypothetical protein